MDKSPFLGSNTIPCPLSMDIETTCDTCTFLYYTHEFNLHSHLYYASLCTN